jgi:hypothetical protein
MRATANIIGDGLALATILFAILTLCAIAAGNIIVQ